MELPIMSESTVFLEMGSKSAGIIWNKLSNKDLATITSFITNEDPNRPDAKTELSIEENRARNRRLMNDLREKDYGPRPVTGMYVTQNTPAGSESGSDIEESYFVVRPDDISFEDFTNDMINLAKEYEQESVIVWNHIDKIAKMYRTQDYENYKVIDEFRAFAFDDIVQRARTAYGKHFFTFMHGNVKRLMTSKDKPNQKLSLRGQSEEDEDEESENSK